MIEWMNENIPTIIGTAVVAYIFFAVIYTRVKAWKSGKGGCACGCENCASRGICHKTDEADKAAGCEEFIEEKPASSVEASIERAANIEVPYEY